MPDGNPFASKPDRPLLIAAPGRSHGGSVERARALIEAAAGADVDAVQLPLYRTDHLVSPVHAPRRAREYRRTELDREAFASLIDAAREAGTRLAPTVYDPTLLEWMLEYNPPYVKFHHGDLTYRRLLRRASGTSVPIHLGVTGGTEGEIRNATGWLDDAADNTAFVARQERPANPDHRSGGWILDADAPPLPRPSDLREARVLEARIHPDDESGGDPTETVTRPLERLRRGIRGDHPTGGDPSAPSGEPASPPCGDLRTVRRSLMAERPLSAGTHLERGMVRELRPGNGIPADRLEACVGLRVARPTDPMEMISIG